MPRINKTTVEFVVDGKIYNALFRHNHAADKKHSVKATFEPGPSGRHLTTCYLKERSSFAWARGEALCGWGDKYDWKKGIKLSFQRSLEKMKLCRFVVWDNMPFSNTRTHIFEVLDAEKYGKFMSAFFTELQYDGPRTAVEPESKKADIVKATDLKDHPFVRHPGYPATCVRCHQGRNAHAVEIFEGQIISTGVIAGLVTTPPPVNTVIDRKVAEHRANRLLTAAKDTIVERTTYMGPLHGLGWVGD